MSKNTIELNPIGTKVKLAEDVIGTIIGIHISGNQSINYEVGWWNGRSYNKETFSSFELTVTTDEKIRIGFAVSK